MSEKKVFSEKEASDLIVLAAKLQEEGPHSGDYTPGVSFDDVKRLAADVGVREEYLVQALGKLGGAGPSRHTTKSFMGYPLSAEFETVVEGEVDPQDFDLVTECFPPTPSSGQMGSPVTQVGRGITVSFSKGMAMGTASVQSRNGRTRIGVKTNAVVGPILQAALGFLSFIFGVVITASKAPAFLPLALALWVAFNVLMFYAFRMGARQDMKKVEEQYNDLIAAVGEQSQLRENLSRSETVTAHESPQELNDHE